MKLYQSKQVWIYMEALICFLSVTEPGLPRRGRQLHNRMPQCIVWKHFCRKLHENEKNWIRGGHIPNAPSRVDPPLLIYKNINHAKEDERKLINILRISLTTNYIYCGILALSHNVVFLHHYLLSETWEQCE